MAISVRAEGTWAAATTQSPSYAIPAGYQAGDLGILVAICKPYTVTSTVDQGWAEVLAEATGATANGNGAGSLALYVATKVLTASETDPTVTRSGSVSPGGGVIIVLQKGAAENWTAAAISAAVETTTQNFSQAITTTAAITSGDWIFALTGVGDDSATFTRATTAISGGPTWSGNVVEYPATHLSSTAGNDCAADLIYRVASSSVASGQSITVTGGLSAAERSGSALFRVAVTAADHKTAVPTAASLTTTGSTPTISLSDNQTAQPTAASLTATGATPDVVVTSAVVAVPSAASLTLTGSTPAVLATDPKTAEPTAASLTVTGETPTVTATDHQAAEPTAASLTLTPSTPDVTVSAGDATVVLPSAAALVFTGATPAVWTPVATVPTAPELALTGDTPTVTATSNVYVVPGPLGLTITGAAPDIAGASVLGGHGPRSSGTTVPPVPLPPLPGPDADEAYLLVL